STIENTRPTVTAVSPTSGATQVPGHTEVSVTFSERMDETSLTASTVRLLDGGVPVNATLSIADDGLSAALSPVGYLNAGTVYTVSVTTGATDTAGNAAVAFTSTFTVDTVAPTVTNVSPSAPAASDTDVVVTFSERMDETSFIESIVGADGTIRLDDGAEEAFLCVHVDGETVTLDPVDPLPIGTVNLTVDPAVGDTAGNPLGSEYTDTVTVQ